MYRVIQISVPASSQPLVCCLLPVQSSCRKFVHQNATIVDFDFPMPRLHPAALQQKSHHFFFCGYVCFNTVSICQCRNISKKEK
ncbi:unnamed protein product [Amoebophrya sp. A120]|nr:unnamed protein product [Amoebophrya sp. A120]|eukprot:GSA120T00018638001.1